MSKRILIVLSVLATLSASNAFASRARVLVMGTGDAGMLLGSSGNTGSFYVDDAYNIFYNPSYVNDYKNWGIIEKSNGTAGPNAAIPGAEGGFVMSVSNFNIGLYMDRASAVNGDFAAAGDAATVVPTRPVDIFVGSDMGVKWGLGFSYASNSFATGSNNTNSDWTIHAGVQVSDLEPFFSYEHGSDDTNFGAVGSSISYNLITAGAKYHWGEWTPYVAFQNNKASANSTSVTVSNTFGIGLGRNTKITEGMRMAYALSYWRNSTSGQNVVPIDFSVEGDALSWLTVRAGLSYHLVDQTGGVSNGDATTGRIGATAHVGKADLDFAVGHSLGASLAFTEGAGGSNIDSQYFDIGSGFFTAAALSYHW